MLPTLARKQGLVAFPIQQNFIFMVGQSWNFHPQFILALQYTLTLTANTGLLNRLSNPTTSVTNRVSLKERVFLYTSTLAAVASKTLATRLFP